MAPLKRVPWKSPMKKKSKPLWTWSVSRGQFVFCVWLQAQVKTALGLRLRSEPLVHYVRDSVCMNMDVLCFMWVSCMRMRMRVSCRALCISVNANCITHRSTSGINILFLPALFCITAGDVCFRFYCTNISVGTGAVSCT